MIALPDFLSHYYEASDGPFRNLSDLPNAEAQAWDDEPLRPYLRNSR